MTITDFLLPLKSGRWILTVMCGATFCYLACNNILDSKDSLMVIILVMNSYFQKKSYETPPVA